MKDDGEEKKIRHERGFATGTLLKKKTRNINPLAEKKKGGRATARGSQGGGSSGEK